MTQVQLKTQRARQEAQDLASAVSDAAEELGSVLKEQLERRPYVALGTAMTIGYVLGGGIPSRLTRLLVDVGTRAAVTALIRELR